MIGILVLVCLLTAAVTGTAETGNDQVEIYVLIRNAENTSDFDTREFVPDYLDALQYMYPDYIDVIFHIYKITDLRNPSRNSCVEILSGNLMEEGIRGRLQEVLSTLGAQDKSGVPMESVYESANATNSKILFIGNFNSDNLGQLIGKWIGTLQEKQYLILNQNTYKPKNSNAQLIPLIKNDVLSMAKDTYLFFNADLYDQSITEEDPTGNEFSGSIPSDVRKTRIIASPKTYYGTNEPHLSTDNVSLLEIPLDTSEYKLELEDNGVTKRVIINTIYQPFHIKRAELMDPKEQYYMSDVVSFECEIEAREGQSIQHFEPSEWLVNTVITTEDGKEETTEMTWNGTSFTCEKALRNASGIYQYKITAQNKTKGWLSLNSEAGSLTVLNEAPVLKTETDEGSREYVIWADDPMKLENPGEIVLSQFFEDDGPLEDLKYQIEGDTPDWIRIENDKIIIDADKADSEAQLKIRATDAGELYCSNLLRIQIKYFPINKLMDNAVVKLTLGGDDEGNFFRDSDIQMEGIIELPETLRLYWDTLAEQNLQNSFVEQITGQFRFADEKLPAIGEIVKAEENSYEPIRIRYTQHYAKLKDPGEVTVVFEAYKPQDKGVLASAEQTIDILNVAASVNVDKIDKEVAKEFPGPLFLNPDIPAEDHVYMIDLKQVIEPEVSEEIYVELTGNEKFSLSAKDNEYFYTDELTDGAKNVERITWKTTEEAPVLYISSKTRGECDIRISVTDERGIEAKGSPVELHFMNSYHNEKMLVMIAAIVAGCIVLLIIFAILHQLLKPKFKEDDILNITCGQKENVIPLQSWGKKPLTLRDVLIYSGAPVYGKLDVKAPDKVELKAGRGKTPIVIKNAKSNGLAIKVDGADQYNNKIKLEKEKTAEIKLNEQNTIKLCMKKTNSNNLNQPK